MITDVLGLFWSLKVKLACFHGEAEPMQLISFITKGGILKFELYTGDCGCLAWLLQLRFPFPSAASSGSLFTNDPEHFFLKQSFKPTECTGESLWADSYLFSPLHQKKCINLKNSSLKKIRTSPWKELLFQRLQHIVPLIWHLLNTVPFYLAIRD